MLQNAQFVQFAASTLPYLHIAPAEESEEKEKWCPDCPNRIQHLPSPKDICGIKDKVHAYQSENANRIDKKYWKIPRKAASSSRAHRCFFRRQACDPSAGAAACAPASARETAAAACSPPWAP